MSTTLIWAFVCLIIFVAVLAHPKLPNWMTFICMAPVVLLAKVMEAKDIYAVLNSSSLHLMIIICMFSGMIAATGLDIIIGDFVDHMTSSQTGKKKEMMIFAIVYSPSEQLCSIGIPSGSQEYCKKEPDQPFQTGFICYFCNDTWRRDHIDRHSDERVCKHRIRGSGSPAVRHA